MARMLDCIVARSLPALLLVGHACLAADAGGQLDPGVPDFTVRPGYRVTLVADRLEEARFLCFDDKGTLYVSQPEKGAIVALRANAGGRYEPVCTFVKDKPKVHAMCFHDGWLWFAQSTSIHKTRPLEGDKPAGEIVTVIPEGKLPGGTGHWWRSLLVTDDALYTSVGDSGNITDETNTERQKIWRFDHRGGGKQLFASGIRNTEKLLFRPGTHELWGCDHGSDNYGQKFGEQNEGVAPNPAEQHGPGARQPVTDLNPPEEFNRYTEGGFYGHPFVVGNKLPRLEYADRKDIVELAEKTIPPEWCFHAHWAPNGWCFLTKDYFPGHKGDAVVAFHGSWDSTVKVGYRVERLLFDPWTAKPYGSQMLVGTLDKNGKDVLARPCDAVEAPDGSILFSCDQTKRIYRISK